MTPIRTFLFLTTTLSCASLFAGDLETILDNYYKARGGLEKLKSLSSYRAEGVVTIESSSVPFTIYVKDGKVRLDLEQGGLEVVQVYDGKRGWQVNPTYGTLEPQLLGRAEVRYLMELTDISGPLVDWKKKGYQLSYLGTEDKNGRNAHLIRGERDNTITRTWFLDASTFLPVFFLEEQPNGPVANRVGDYMRVAGITFANNISTGAANSCTHSVHDARNNCDFSKNMILKDLEVNLEIDDQLFREEQVVASLTD